MKINSLFDKGRPVISFEIFPPKREGEIGNIFDTLDCLKTLSPDFISVTFGAGGGDNGAKTCEVAGIIKRDYGVEPLAHLTCLGQKRYETAEILDKLKENGVENILALRGDKPADGSFSKGDFEYAADLISFIKERGDFHVSGACYPEGHTEAASLIDDVKNLKKKVDSGASHLISQLFFDNRIFYSFVEKARIAGIEVPIEAGIMPVVNKKQIERMVSLCGASLPLKFRRIIERYEHHPEALRDAGIAYAVDQMVDLMAQGVDGIHLYTMNNVKIAEKICRSIENLVSVRAYTA